MSKSAVAAIVAALGIGVAIGFLAGERGGAPADRAVPADERVPLFYRNPMNPEITSPVPAKDEMGMEYIPVFADDAAGNGPAGTVRIDPVTVQNIGVRTALVERRTIGRIINTVGRIDYDERHLYRLHPKTDGWVEALRVDTTGERIDKGDILMSIYSPQLVSTQQEYLLALKNLDALQASAYPDVRHGAEELLQTSLERLRLLDVPEHQIAELRRTREAKKLLHIHAPEGGIVTTVGVRDGQYITPQNELYTIADLDRIWVLVDVYEDELPWVSIGDRADMTVRAQPGKVFSGKLTYIYPYADADTRTVKARLEFDNPDLGLKPDMFAKVTIHAAARDGVIGVPSEAIVRSGLREKVFIARGEGRFEPRDVVTGVTGDGFTEIIDGLHSGERVVISAQFLIDSESKLREAASKMQADELVHMEGQHDHPAD